MRAPVEKRSVLGWNKSLYLFHYPPPPPYLWYLHIYITAPPIRPSLPFLLRAMNEALGAAFQSVRRLHSYQGGVINIPVMRQGVQFSVVLFSTDYNTRIGSFSPPPNPPQKPCLIQGLPPPLISLIPISEGGVGGGGEGEVWEGQRHNRFCRRE